MLHVIMAFITNKTPLHELYKSPSPQALLTTLTEASVVHQIHPSPHHTHQAARLHYLSTSTR